VRGTRESMLFGNNGFFIRNDLVWRTQPFADKAELERIFGELRRYVGLDYGRIAAEPHYGIAGGDMVGWTVGAKLAGGNLNLEIGYSDVFGGTVETRDTGLLFVSAFSHW